MRGGKPYCSIYYFTERQEAWKKEKENKMEKEGTKSRLVSTVPLCMLYFQLITATLGEKC